MSPERDQQNKTEIWDKCNSLSPVLRTSVRALSKRWVKRVQVCETQDTHWGRAVEELMPSLRKQLVAYQCVKQALCTRLSPPHPPGHLGCLRAGHLAGEVWRGICLLSVGRWLWWTWHLHLQTKSTPKFLSKSHQFVGLKLWICQSSLWRGCHQREQL